MRERRQIERIKAELPIAYRSLDPGFRGEGISVNVSGGGICLYLAVPLPTGTRVHIELTLPGRPDPVRFIGEVRWCELPKPAPAGASRGSGTRVTAGIQIISIEPADRDALARFFEEPPPYSPAP